MNRVFLTAIFLFTFTSFMSLNAQWLKGYGEGRPSSIQQTSDGGYIVAGAVGFVITDAMLLKLDSAGDIEWKRNYGDDEGFYDVWASSVQQTNDGGYIIAGGEGYMFTGPDYFWVLKLDSAGDIEWQRTYGGSYEDNASSIQQTSDGGYIVAGDTYSSGAGGADIWIIKLSSNGDIEWQRTYGGNVDDYASFIQQTSDGGYIVAGGRSWSRLIWIVKLSSNGDIEWQRTYGGSYASSIQETSDGGYIVAGGTHPFGAEDVDGWFFKLDSAGDIEWQRTLRGSDYDSASSIQETSDGGYIVAGSFRVEVTGEWGGMTYDYIRILKLFSDGDIHTYCEYISSSNATITDTDISPEVSYLSYQDTNVTPLDTDFPALLLSKNMPATTLCPPESTLDDEDDDPGKKCFIATAAYGSPLHPHLDILRDFRNKYLMPNKLGRAFVNLYYKYSPFVANIIAKRKVLKVVVRVSLLPLIALSYTILHFGHTITAILGGFIFLIPIFFVWFCQRKIRRLEAKFPKALAFLD